MSGLKGYERALEAARKAAATTQQVDAAAAAAAQQIPLEQQPGNPFQAEQVAVPVPDSPTPFLSGLTRGLGAGGKGSDDRLKKEIAGSFSGSVGEVAGTLAGPMTGSAIGTGLGMAAGVPLAPYTGGMSVPALAAVGGGLGTAIGGFPSAYGRHRQAGEDVWPSIKGGAGDAAMEGVVGMGVVGGVGAAALVGNRLLRGASGVMRAWAKESGEEAAQYATKTYGTKAANTMANNGVRTYASPLVDAQNVAVAESKVARSLGEVYDITKSIPTPADGFPKAWDAAWKHSAPLRGADKEVLAKLNNTLKKNIFTSDPLIDGGKPFIAVKSIQDARLALKEYVAKHPQAGPAVKQIRENLLEMFRKRLPYTPDQPLRQTFDRLHKAKKDLNNVKRTLSGIV